MIDHPTFDVIVIGVGGMGSAATFHLAQRGLEVLGLEQFDIPNDQGSSHGVNRIFRLAYYEDPGYVPLMMRARDLWLELERRHGSKLVHVTGTIDAGLPDSEVFEGSLASCRIHGLDHEVLDSAELSQRYPGYRLPREMMSVYQPDGGFLLSEQSIVAHVNGAIAAGADIRGRERVTGWELGGLAPVTVHTDRGTYLAEQLVVTAGAWVSSLVPMLADLATPERQVLGWFQPLRPEIFAEGRFPVFNLAAEEGRFYGFPVFGIPGVKIGRYHHLEETTAPDEIDRRVSAADEKVLRTAIARYFPEADGPLMTLKTCMFTNTPDEHFLIDTMAGSPNVHIAAGFSGHGFKFCSVVGEILGELVASGTTTHDISRFALSRFD
ncbi:MAG: N-methyl-L-tryptophan oxidase [Acidimicrobiia bacterium]